MRLEGSFTVVLTRISTQDPIWQRVWSDGSHLPGFPQSRRGAEPLAGVRPLPTREGAEPPHKCTGICWQWGAPNRKRNTGCCWSSSTSRTIERGAASSRLSFKNNLERELEVEDGVEAVIWKLIVGGLCWRRGNNSLLVRRISGPCMYVWMGHK